jgi:hypothetical protein
MKVEFRTTEYEFSHSKQPRGYGYWGFGFPGTDDVFWFTGSYGDAKKAARDEARRRNFAEVKVMP